MRRTGTGITACGCHGANSNMFIMGKCIIIIRGVWVCCPHLMQLKIPPDSTLLCILKQQCSDVLFTFLMTPPLIHLFLTQSTKARVWRESHPDVDTFLLPRNREIFRPLAWRQCRQLEWHQMGYPRNAGVWTLWRSLCEYQMVIEG